MKRIARERKDSESAKGTVEALAPRTDPPAAGATHKVIMHVGSKRFELACRVEIREIPRAPAKVIEMPGPANA